MIIACNKLCSRGGYEANSDHENDAHDCDQEGLIMIMIMRMMIMIVTRRWLIIMVMPALSEDSSETIRVMNKSKELHQVMTKEYSFANTLSMGTTSDYMHAIDCGSSMIRIGELIFGKRQL